MSTRLGRMSTSGQPGDEAGISQRGQEGKWTERQPQDGQAFSLHLFQQDENPNVLPLAAMHGNAGAVRVLLGAGADPKALDNSDELPFDYARDNEKLQGTDAYWKLNEARFP